MRWVLMTKHFQRLLLSSMRNADHPNEVVETSTKIEVYNERFERQKNTIYNLPKESNNTKVKEKELIQKIVQEISNKKLDKEILDVLGIIIRNEEKSG